MKIVKIILLLVILFIFCSSISFGFSNITGFSVNSITSLSIINMTGLATAFSSALVVMIDANAPGVEIIYPLNDTYNYWDDIALEINYSDLSDISAILYNLDNGENNSITGNTTFDLSADGSHTLYVYVNDTHGFLNNSESVTFFINLSEGHKVDLSDDFDGDSTDIENMTKEEQENITNLTFHDLDRGKIVFNDNINLTYGTTHDNNTKNIINLSRDVIIEDNRIFINITGLPCFNNSATLVISNLTFTNPRVLRDGEVCLSNICTIESYNGGNLTFNVTGFSEYKAEETPTSSTTPIATGGGGGGKGIGITESKDVGNEGEKEGKSEEEKPLKIKINIPENYEKVPVGDKLKVEIKIEGIKETNKLIIYEIKDLENNNLMEEYEYVELKDYKTFLVQTIKIPEEFEPGKYILTVITYHNREIYLDNAEFEVVGWVSGEEKLKRIILKEGWYIVGILVLIIILILISRFITHLIFRGSMR